MAALDETESVLFRVRWPNFAEAGEAVRDGKVADDGSPCDGIALALELAESCPRGRGIGELPSFDPFEAGLAR